MKTFKIILVLLFFSSLGFAQSNNKSFSDTTLWHMHSGFTWTGGQGGPPHDENFDRYRAILNDTIINDTLYQKLYVCDSIFSTHSLMLLGYFKNVNKKIYYGTSIDSMSLMFNYNLAVGDTFRFNSFDNFNEPTDYLVHVNTVDSININGSYRKRIRFDEFPDSGNYCSAHISVAWVEGVGDYNYGLINDYGLIMFVACNPSGGSSLVCFSENNNPVIGNCTLYTGINNKAFNHVNLFPNPANTFIRLKTRETIQKLELYNLSGRQAKDFYFNKSSKIIDIHLLQSGMYFAKIYFKDMIITKKIMITR